MAWNIRAGGGKRVDRILASLHAWTPDVVVLSEFRATAPSRTLAGRLAELGLTHQRTSATAAAPTRNALLVAARHPLRRLRAEPTGDDGRILPTVLAVPTRGFAPGPAPAALRITAIHVPNRVTGRKYAFLDAVVRHASRAGADRPGIIVGDTNSGRRIVDEERSAFNAREESWFAELDRCGWVDVYRHLHGRRRVYSWYSPNGDNGFRLDQLFATRALLPRLRHIEYRWAERGRRSGVSDHAAIIADVE